jgi:hypothetical protein
MLPVAVITYDSSTAWSINQLDKKVALFGGSQLWVSSILVLHECEVRSVPKL